MFFGQKTLMFGLQVNAVLRFVLKTFAGIFHDLDRFAVGNAGKIVVDDRIERVFQTGGDKFFKQFHVFGAMFHNMFNTVSDHVFRQIHVVGEVGKSHFRLNHPKFRRMPGGVGVFRPKRGAESINVAERRRIHFAV